MARTFRQNLKYSYFRRPKTIAGKRALMAFADEAMDIGAQQAAQKAIAKANALPDAWDDIASTTKPRYEHILRKQLGANYKKFVSLSKIFEKCYGKTLFELAGVDGKLDWHLLADTFIVQDLLRLELAEAMEAIHCSYAEKVMQCVNRRKHQLMCIYCEVGSAQEKLHLLKGFVLNIKPFACKLANMPNADIALHGNSVWRINKCYAGESYFISKAFWFNCNEL